MSYDPYRQKPDDEQDSGGISTSLLFGGWVIAFALLTLAFSHYFDDKNKYRDNPNRIVNGRITDTGKRIVKLRKNYMNHYVANGKINGHNVTFLVDTGASGVSVPTSVAKRIGLKAGNPHRVSTANGYSTVYATRLNSLELGPIRVNNVRAHINPGLTDKQILLGMNVLRHLDIRIKGRTMTLVQDPK